MNLELFCSLIKNLLHVEVLLSGCTDGNVDLCCLFERRYCYNSMLQPMYTAKSLETLTVNAQEGVLYEISDLLGICADMMVLEGKAVILGPFVRTEFRESVVRTVLARAGFSDSYLESIRIFFSGLPRQNSGVVRDTVTACLRSLADPVYELSVCPVIPEEKLRPAPEDNRLESFDYNTVYRRYALENRFLQMIEDGNVNGVEAAYLDMNASGLEHSRYVNAIFREPAVGVAILRTLARKAAERGGAPVTEINEITQRANQRALSTHDLSEIADINRQMLIELTDSVRRSRETFNGCSGPVRRVIEYMRMNYGQEISLDRLAEVSGLAPTYLSARFREETGSTVSGSLAAMRCSRACELLKTGNLSVQEISSYVGYSDSNYFVKVFKKHIGMTPTEYRRKNR